MRAVLLFVLLALAAAAAALPWILPDPVKPQVAVGRSAPALESGGALPDFPPLSTLTETAGRPLFSPARRPVDNSPATIPLSDATRSLILGRYAKTGVVVTGTHRIVMLRDTVKGRGLRLKEGDRLDGWLIEAIGFDTLVLRDGENILEFDLKSTEQGE